MWVSQTFELQLVRLGIPPKAPKMRNTPHGTIKNRHPWYRRRIKTAPLIIAQVKQDNGEGVIGGYTLALWIKPP
jgi:hypothetical protein